MRFQILLHFTIFLMFVSSCSSKVSPRFSFIRGPQTSEKWPALSNLFLLLLSWTGRRREGGELSARKGKDIYLTDGQDEMGWKQREKRKHLAHRTPVQMLREQRRKTEDQRRRERGKESSRMKKREQKEGKEKSKFSWLASFPDVLWELFHSGSCVSPPFFHSLNFPLFHGLEKVGLCKEKEKTEKKDL